MKQITIIRSTYSPYGGVERGRLEYNQRVIGKRPACHPFDHAEPAVAYQ